MTQTLALHIVAAQGAAAEEAKRHLPMSAAAFALLALGTFLLLLAVTWAFRSSGTKH
jgi:disulfide bond formation protein DsbB